MRWLEDAKPGSEIIHELISPNMVGISLWGYPEHLDSVRDSVARVIAGLRLAERWLAKHDDNEVAAALQRTEFFSHVKPSELAFGLPLVRPIWVFKTEGFISGEDWDNASIPTWAKFDLGFDDKEAMYNYANRVDMSYWKDSDSMLKTVQ